MNVLPGLTGPRRLLTLGVVLAVAMALLSLTQAQRADAQIVLYAPDLKVTSHEVKYLGGPFFAPGYYLVITVKNTGNANAAPSTVQVRSTNNVVLQSFQMTAKQPGQGAMIHHKLPDPGNCGYLVETRRIVVDAFNTVNEWAFGESNNIVDLTHGYGPGPC